MAYIAHEALYSNNIKNEVGAGSHQSILFRGNLVQLLIFILKVK